MTNKIKIRFFHKAFRLGQERIVICFKEEPSGYWWYAPRQEDNKK